MRRYFILTFVLLLVVVVQVMPPTDILDGDGGFSYAILTKAHFHPLGSSQVSPLSLPNAHSATAEPASVAGISGNEALAGATPPKLARVLRC